MIFQNLTQNFAEKPRKSRKKFQLSRFHEEYAEQIDLFSRECGRDFPDWIYNYRDKQLSSFTKTMRGMCRRLKDAQIDFVIKFPMEGDGKYKFADIYIPDKRIVLVEGSIYSPAAWESVRASFFRKHCNCQVIEFDACDDAARLDDILTRVLDAE